MAETIDDDDPPAAATADEAGREVDTTEDCDDLAEATEAATELVAEVLTEETEELDLTVAILL